MDKIGSKQEEKEMQKKLDRLYTKYLNTVYLQAIRRKERETEKSKLEQCMVNMQSVLIHRQMELNKWKKKVETLKMINEIELLRKTSIPHCEQVLEQVTADNFEEEMVRVTAHLEAANNQLLLRKIEMPRDDGKELQQILNETSEAMVKLQELSNSNEFTNKVKCLELREKHKENLKQCEESSLQLEKLSTLNASMEMDLRKIDSLSNPFL